MNGEDSGPVEQHSVKHDSIGQHSAGQYAGEQGVEPEVSNKSRRIAYVVAVLAALLVAGVVLLVATNKDDDDKNTAAPVTPTTSTTVATTTTMTTTVDPHQQYVGLLHDDRGAGLQVGSTIVSEGYRTEGDIKVGDYAYFWIRDAKGDMFWLDQITKAPKNVEPLQAKVIAVWDVPTLSDSASLCMGACYDAKDKIDPSVVATFDENGKVQKAWRVATSPPAFATTASAGWKPYPTVPEVPEIKIPARPELYGAAVTAGSDDRATYNNVEQVVVGGGGNFQDGFMNDVLDHKENKRVLVFTKDNKVLDTAVTNLEDTASFIWGSADNPVFAYNGKVDAGVIAYTVPQGEGFGNIYAAFRLDPSTHKFVSLDTSKVTQAPTK